MKGVHVEITKLFTKSSQNYIITSRVIQGRRELRDSTFEERNDIIARWNTSSNNLKSFYQWKRKGKAAQKAPATAEAYEFSESAEPGRSSSWFSSLRPNTQGSSSTIGSSAQATTADDAEFESAIQASVQQTSKGNAEEDAIVENAIRESVHAVRQRGGLPEPRSILSEKHPHHEPTVFEDAEYQITDEEYQSLIEQAIQDSLGSHSTMTAPAAPPGRIELDAGIPELPPREHENDSDLNRAIEESKNIPQETPRRDEEEDDAEFQRAIAASKDEMERQKNERTEEDIVMEYIKKQSLAEEEYRKQRLEAGGAKNGENAAVEEEELKRAMEESLRLSRGDDAGPSNMRDES
jgi:hypothetical protein